jgi:putative phage-type endonuclease
MTKSALDFFSTFQCEVVCEDTDAVSREEWLELRRTGLGGSDAAASMGLSPYMSPVALYLDKVDPQPDEDKEIFEAGRRAEPLITSWFADQNKLVVERQPVMLRSTKWNWMLANVDAFVTNSETGEIEILEAKNVGSYNAKEWAEGPPLHVRLQGQHYLAVTGLSRVYFAALIGGNKFTWFAVDRDEELIADMVKAEERMWTLITLQRMPEIDGSESTKEALRAHYANATREEIEVDDEFVTLLQRRATQKAAIEIETQRLNEIENRMIVLMDGAEVARHDGDIVAKWQVVQRKEYTVAASESRRWSVPKGAK